jgi:hypothetical protein
MNRRLLLEKKGDSVLFRPTAPAEVRHASWGAKKYAVPFFLVVIVLGAFPLSVRAEHANIDLRVYHLDPATRQIKGQSSASADEDPPPGGVNPRPLLKVKAGEPLVLQFFYTNTYPHGPVKDVAVRYFVAREEKPRQKSLPDLKAGTVVEGKFDLNFKLGAKVGARMQFTIPKPGIYLLRVQSERTKSDHEHFAAIDLQVE